MSTRSELNNLKSQDVYTLMLFALYKIKDVPEYSSISELAYVLDKDNLLALCEYFGGTTIKIPTIDELEQLIYSLMLYQYVDIDKMNYDDAVKLIGHKSSELRQVKSIYNQIKNILKNYSFKHREV